MRAPRSSSLPSTSALRFFLAPSTFLMRGLGVILFPLTCDGSLTGLLDVTGAGLRICCG